MNKHPIISIKNLLYTSHVSDLVMNVGSKQWKLYLKDIVV